LDDCQRAELAALGRNPLLPFEQIGDLTIVVLNAIGSVLEGHRSANSLQRIDGRGSGKVGLELIRNQLLIGSIAVLVRGVVGVAGLGADLVQGLGTTLAPGLDCSDKVGTMLVLRIPQLGVVDGLVHLLTEQVHESVVQLL